MASGIEQKKEKSRLLPPEAFSDLTSINADKVWSMEVMSPPATARGVTHKSNALIVFTAVHLVVPS